MILDEARQTFVAESRELLEELESGLLALERDPEDGELINSLFRAAHTIKGSGGIFGYQNLVGFTHRVETVLDWLRGGRLKLSETLMADLLQARDHMAHLVEKEVTEGELTPQERAQGQTMEQRLAAYLSEPEPIPAEMMIPVPSMGADEATVWYVLARFDRGIFRHGLDPLALIRYLRGLGDIEGIAFDLGALPEPDEFHPEDCYLNLALAIRGDLTRRQLEEAFEFFQEDSDIRIIPSHSANQHYLSLIESLPDTEVGRLGEILLSVGALTDGELKRALEQQCAHTEHGDPIHLGELVSRDHSVAPAVVQAAVEKQRISQETLSRSLRIDADKLDTLINLVGELVIAGAATHLIARQIDNEPLRETNSVMKRLVEEIRDTALRLRMVPIGESFNRFHRVVRDLAKELNKDVRLLIEGGETELDKTVIEKISDPLMHLVRNAMDHGLEGPDERQRIGKAEHGTVRLSACHDSGGIVIEIADDGRGIDEQKLLAKAIDKGVIPAGQSPGSKEILSLMFEPGLSTAATVSNVSGRGVGMDVVRRNIEALRGSIEVENHPGQGAIFRIRLPLTLAIIDGFLVRIGASSYVIPLDMVLECVEVEAGHATASEDHYINLRDEVLPYLKLREVFGECESSSRRENIVVVQHGDQKVGLVVDGLLGEVQTVIKPLGKLFRNVVGISGATILGSGEVAVILDVPQLIQMASSDRLRCRGKRTIAA